MMTVHQTVDAPFRVSCSSFNRSSMLNSLPSWVTISALRWEQAVCSSGGSV